MIFFSKKPQVGPQWEVDVLYDAIAAMHGAMPEGELAVVFSRLRSMMSALDGTLLIGTGCSGSDLVVLALHRMCRYWEETMGLRIGVSHQFSVENVEWKRKFIADNLSPQYLFKDMEKMCEDQVFDTISDSWVSIRSPHVFVCGIECDSVSSCCSHSSENRDCVQSSTGATGESADASLRFIAKFKPLLVCFENVKNLDAQSTQDNTPSNKVAILEKLAKLGYETCDMLLSSLDYGTAQRRPRIYVAAFRHDQATTEGKPIVPSDMQRVPQRVKNMRIGHKDISAFLLPAGDAKLVAWLAGLRAKASEKAAKVAAGQQGQDGTPSKQQRTKVERDKWRTDHLEAFSAHKVEWPPKIPDEFEEKLAGCSQRMKEIAWLNHLLAERGDGKERCTDLNMSISWGGGDSVGFTPCIICSSTIFLARRCRVLWGIEAMTLQMWPGASSLEQYGHEKLMDLAGNAFTGGCVAAVLIALLTSQNWSSEHFKHLHANPGPTGYATDDAVILSDEDDGADESESS